MNVSAGLNKMRKYEQKIAVRDCGVFGCMMSLVKSLKTQPIETPLLNIEKSAGKYGIE